MQSLVDDLNALGNTPDEVAAKLKSLGIRGCLVSSEYCPTANYMKSKGYKDVGVGLFKSMIDGLIIDTPVPVQQFMFKFDVGGYPELIEEQ